MQSKPLETTSLQGTSGCSNLESQPSKRSGTIGKFSFFHECAQAIPSNIPATKNLASNARQRQSFAIMVSLLMAASYGRLLGTLFLKDLAPRGTLLGPRSALTSNFGAGSSDWQVGNSRASAGSFLFGCAICPNMIWVVRLDSSSSRSSRRREQLTKGLAHIYEHQSGSESDHFMFSTRQC